MNHAEHNAFRALLDSAEEAARVINTLKARVRPTRCAPCDTTYPHGTADGRCDWCGRKLSGMG